jgi:hypothetical protein
MRPNSPNPTGPIRAGRGGGGERCASEPAPGHESCPVTRIEPLCFGGRRTSERRSSGLDLAGQCRAVCSRLMCHGVHPPCRSVGATATRIPSDSRHLLEFRQALLRRGKQILVPEHLWAVGNRTGTKVAYNRRTQAPCPSPLSRRRAAHNGRGLRPLLQTTVYGRLIDL